MDTSDESAKETQIDECNKISRAFRGAKADQCVKTPKHSKDTGDKQDQDISRREHIGVEEAVNKVRLMIGQDQFLTPGLLYWGL